VILKAIKITLINFLILLILIILLYFFSYSMKNLLGGPVLYSHSQFKIKNSDIIKYKSHYYKFSQVKNDFYKYYSIKYNEENYSGKLIKIFCGKEENGVFDLIYKTDKFGFRENSDKLYKQVDYVLLGDSFIFSICINKPNDLISQLKKKSNKTLLNLGVWGSQPWSQLAYFQNVTKDTNIENLIWFFYEGNDYEQPFIKMENYYNKIFTMNKKDLFNLITTSTVGSYTNNLNINNKNFYSYEVENTKFKKDYLEIIKIKFLESIVGIHSVIKFFKQYNNLLNYEDYNGIVKKMNFFLKEKNVKKKYIYYIPSYLRLSYTNNYFNNFNNQINQLNFLKKQVQQIAEKNGFEFIDGTKIFNKKNIVNNIFFYGLPTHFNEKGYEMMAEDIYEQIIKY